MNSRDPSRPRPIDDVDLALLRHLAQDARRSNREIARTVGMSSGAITERIERLRGAGIIRGYHADVDPAALGFPIEVLIGLQVSQGSPVEDTIDALFEVPEVASVSLVTGQWDFVVELRVRDQNHLREVLIGKVWSLPIFRHSETMVTLERRERPGSWLVGQEDSES
jgi:DNA-binding Lrp family transcriptional regulator